MKSLVVICVAIAAFALSGCAAHTAGSGKNQSTASSGPPAVADGKAAWLIGTWHGDMVGRVNYPSEIAFSRGGDGAIVFSTLFESKFEGRNPVSGSVLIDGETVRLMGQSQGRWSGNLTGEFRRLPDGTLSGAGVNIFGAPYTLTLTKMR